MLKKTSKITKSSCESTTTTIFTTETHPQMPFTHFLNTSRGGDSVIPLGSLFQCSSTLSMKIFFFLVSNVNLPWGNKRQFLYPRKDNPIWS